MPLNTGTVVPNTRESDSQRLGILFPTPGNPVPNTRESCSRAGSCIRFAGGRKKQERKKSDRGRGFVLHGGERTQRRNQHRCAEKGTLGREKKQEKREEREKRMAQMLFIISHPCIQQKNPKR